MNIEKESYVKYAKAKAKKSKLFPNCVKAFLVGGLICTLAQGWHDVCLSFGMTEETVNTIVPATLIFLAALLTGLGVFDKIAKHAGAGTLVPITGFANAVVSPALDTKAEGLILGVGAKIFTIAGPVILYGTLASVLYGVIFYIVQLF